MTQDWFEMRKLKRRRFNTASWVPLRAANVLQKTGSYGYKGYREEFFGAGTLAVPMACRKDAEELDWMSLGISNDHYPYVQDDEYIPADTYPLGDSAGIRLALEQRGNTQESRMWCLHPDLLLGLRLRQEGDVWLCIEEGYQPVVRLTRDPEGKPVLLEIRAEHLKDFLAASSMALYINSYRSRRIVTDSPDIVDWPDGSLKEEEKDLRWEGRIFPIHEGGMRYGEEWSVLQASRTDVDPEEDVPLMPFPTKDSQITTTSWTGKSNRPKLFYVEGEFWRSEWVEPGEYSTRIRDDERPSTVHFVIDTEGARVNSDELIESGRWLWFRPDVIMALAHRRGGSLSWYTRDTGSVTASPDYGVHFGMNSLGLVNVYAKDIALLPEWQRQIWGGYSTNPDGGVSAELLASQTEAQPADTQAPEPFLAHGLDRLNKFSQERLDFEILHEHEKVPEIIDRTHRFRALDRSGLFALAKDIARLTAETIDASAINQYLSIPKKESLGSLKALERLLATKVDPDIARQILSPLVGAYEMRHVDAHLPSADIQDSLELANIDENAPFVIQGYQLLRSCVNSIWQAIAIIKD